MSDLPIYVDTGRDLRDFVDDEARVILGVSWEQALEMLDRGELRGTSAEAELKMLRFLLGDPILDP